MLKNSAFEFGLVSILLHWLLAILILGLIALGWVITKLDYGNPWYYQSFTIHMSVGLLVLILVLIKLIWTKISPLPKPLPSLLRWEIIASKAMHHTLVLMMVLIPISGYLMSVATGSGISFFGLFDIPSLMSKPGQEQFFGTLHYYLGYGTAWLILFHVLAAFKHELINRDGTLRRMLRIRFKVE